jgi:prepilin-type processing-associated H-X9-DG protein
VHGETDWEFSARNDDAHFSEPMYRHNDGANVVFCDGHTEYRKKTELFFFQNGNNPNLAGSNVDVIRNDKMWRYFQ